MDFQIVCFVIDFRIFHLIIHILSYTTKIRKLNQLNNMRKRDIGDSEK